MQNLCRKLTSWKASHSSVEPSTSVSTKETVCPLSGGPFFLFHLPTYLGNDMRVHSTMIGTATAIRTAKGIMKYRKALSCWSTTTHLQPMHLFSHKVLDNKARQEMLIRMQAMTMCLTAATNKGKHTLKLFTNGHNSLPEPAALNATKARRLWCGHASAVRYMHWLLHVQTPHSHQLTSIDLALLHMWMCYAYNRKCKSIPHSCHSQAQC